MDMYSSRIAGILATFDRERVINRDTVVALFTTIRKYLEQNELKDKYKYINLFCNWMAHPALERGIIADILDEIQTLFDEAPQDMEPNDKINFTLGTRQLRSEILELLRSLGINSYVINSYQGWDTIMHSV